MSAPPPDARPAPDADADEPKKRAAFAGQWRTPPLPVFPTSSAASDHGDSQVSSSTDSNEVSLKLPPNIPLSTEDYQKALQEAYRRGAEAATARALAQGTPAPGLLPSTASCPDLQQQQQQPVDAELDETMQILPPSPTEQQQPTAEIAASSAASFDPTMPPPPMMPAASVLPPLGPAPPIFQPSQQRSMSLPDMTSYGAKQEEEKRQKRLARNRASARLRRLRKKNLVSVYCVLRDCCVVWSRDGAYSNFLRARFHRSTHTKPKLAFWKRHWSNSKSTHGAHKTILALWWKPCRWTAVSKC